MDRPTLHLSKGPKLVRDRVNRRSTRMLDYLSIAISCLSLTVAAGSAYYQQLRVSHSVLCGVARLEMSAMSMVNSRASETGVEGEVLIENVGNRNEVIDNIAYEYSGTVSGGYIAGPIVVKSGEVKLIPFNATVDVAPIDFDDQQFRLNVDVFQADGRERHTTIPYNPDHKVRDIMLIGTAS